MGRRKKELQKPKQESNRVLSTWSFVIDDIHGIDKPAMQVIPQKTRLIGWGYVDGKPVKIRTGLIKRYVETTKIVITENGVWKLGLINPEYESFLRGDTPKQKAKVIIYKDGTKVFEVKMNKRDTLDSMEIVLTTDNKGEVIKQIMSNKQKFILISIYIVEKSAKRCINVANSKHFLKIMSQY